VSLGFKQPRCTVDLDATGFVIARGENRRILACTWSSQKFDHRAPPGHLLARCFIGGSKGEGRLAEDDAGLIRIAREELRDIMGLADEPVVSAVFRWPGANPIYEVGHEARVREIESIASRVPGLHLAGSGLRGVGIPDCIHDGRRIAELLAKT
jgi:oxygen-dependent protoporphyrinogen oxidase